jgi:hypothetical protein
MALVTSVRALYRIALGLCKGDESAMAALLEGVLEGAGGCSCKQRNRKIGRSWVGVHLVAGDGGAGGEGDGESGETSPTGPGAGSDPGGPMSPWRPLGS